MPPHPDRRAAAAGPGPTPSAPDSGSEPAGSLRPGLVVVDGAGRVTCWNRAAERLLGWSAGEVLGSDVADVLPDLIGGPAPGAPVDRWREGSALDRSGTPIPLLMRVSPLHPTSEQRAGCAALFRPAGSEETHRRVDRAARLAHARFSQSVLAQVSMNSQPESVDDHALDRRGE